MRTYLLKRLLLLVPTLFILSFCVFMLIRLLPGDAVLLKLQDRPQLNDVEALRHELGLSRPWMVQFWYYLADIFRGDFGRSLFTDKPVTEELQHRFPVTLELVLLSLTVNLVIALPTGIIAAIRQDSAIDYALRTLSIFGLAVPSFWLATMAILLPAIWWQWTPPLEYKSLWDDPVSNLTQMGQPAIILGLGSGAIVMRMIRSQMLEVLRQDYVRTAWAKGLGERTIILRHALRNALIPVLTILGWSLGASLAGSVILEQIYALPGLGRFILTGIQQRDYPIVQTFVLFVGIGFLLINLAVDLAYGWLDPRIRYS